MLWPSCTPSHTPRCTPMEVDIRLTFVRLIFPPWLHSSRNICLSDDDVQKIWIFKDTSGPIDLKLKGVASLEFRLGDQFTKF